MSILLATRDAELQPELSRASGARVHDDGAHVTVFVPSHGADRLVQNLRAHDQVAVMFSRPIDHQTVQLKGRCVDVRAAPEGDRAFVERYHACFSEQVTAVGLPRALVSRFAVWPAHAITVLVDAVFAQTPGPGAGARLGA